MSTAPLATRSYNAWPPRYSGLVEQNFPSSVGRRIAPVEGIAMPFLPLRLAPLVLAATVALSPHISQVSRCAGWLRAGRWFRTWPARVPAAVGGWAGSTMVSLVAGLVESRSQAAAALRNRA